MIPVPPGMMDAAARSHAPRWRITTDDGQDWSRRLLGGGITRTSSASPRSRCRFDLATDAGPPEELDQGLLPTGRDVRVTYRIANDPAEVVLFTGRLVASAIARTRSVWSMEAVDHSAVVAQDVTRPEDWWQMPTTVDALIRGLVLRTLPGAVFDITGPCVGAPVPADLEMDGDPWQIVEGLAQGCGSEPFFDAAGTCVVRPEPVLADTGADWLKVGPEGVITSFEVAHEAAYSRVEIRYEDKSDPPVVVIGVWEDHRPHSPTSVERIGRVTLRTDHGGLLGLPSPEAAADAAAALAHRSAGLGRRAAVEHIPRPWIEPGDTVLVTLSGGPTELQMVESVDVPLGPGVQVTALRNAWYTIVGDAA